MRPPRSLTLALLVTSILAIEVFITARQWELPFVWAWLCTFGLILTLAFATVQPVLDRTVHGSRDAFIPYVGSTAIVAILFVVGLDLRFQWFDPLPVWVSLLALPWFAIGMLVTTWAIGVNPSFMMRLRAEPPPPLVKIGPYAIVRHPGYAGMMLLLVTTGPAMGSWLATLPGLAAALIVAVRAFVEDRVLRRSVTGYPDYARQVRRRFVHAGLLLRSAR
ncbi:MAG: methyltransferase family protein [Planctomycetota bacterium]